MNLLDAISFTSTIRDKQYPTGKVNAVDFKYLPVEKQLYVLGQSRSADNSRLYKTTIVFEGVTNTPEKDNKHPIPYSSKGAGIDYYIEPLTVTTRIRTRCQCQDYYFMFEYWNKKQKALVGPHKPYIRVSPPSGRPEVNPTHAPGCCKHILNLTKKLMADGVMKKDPTTWQYLNRSPRSL